MLACKLAVVMCRFPDTLVTSPCNHLHLFRLCYQSVPLQDCVNRLSAPPRPKRKRGARHCSEAAAAATPSGIASDQMLLTQPLQSEPSPQVKQTESVPEVLAPVELTEAAEDLLQKAIALNKAALAQDPASADLLKRFLASPGVLKDTAWSKLFGCQPPRRVVARLARRAEITLREDVGFFNYRCRKEFVKEVGHVRRCYSQGRKEMRRCQSRKRNILRSLI